MLGGLVISPEDTTQALVRTRWAVAFAPRERFDYSDQIGAEHSCVPGVRRDAVGTD